MLNKDQLVTEIGPESFLLDILLPVPHGFVVDHSQTMESHRSQGSWTVLLSDNCFVPYDQLEETAHDGNE